MIKKNTVGSGLLLLLIAGAVGYGVGFGLDALISGDTPEDGINGCDPLVLGA